MQKVKIQTCSSQPSSSDLIQSGNAYIYNGFAGTTNNPLKGREHTYGVVVNYNIPPTGFSVTACIKFTIQLSQRYHLHMVFLLISLFKLLLQALLLTFCFWSMKISLGQELESAISYLLEQIFGLVRLLDVILRLYSLLFTYEKW